MSHQSLVQMAGSPSLIGRIGAAAALLGREAPIQWAQSNMWKIITTDGWQEAWDYAESSKSVNVNQDTGMRDDVINDQMITDAVESVLAETTPTPPEQ